MEDKLIATSEGDRFVSQKWMFLAEMLQDYNPSLELRWIPIEKREAEDRDKPYVVVSKDKQGKSYIVLYASELDQPEEIMTRVINSDMKHGNVLERMEVRNNVNKLFEMRAKEEELAEQEEFATWLVKTNKVNPTFRDKNGDLVKLDSQLNRVKRKSYH